MHKTFKSQPQKGQLTCTNHREYLAGFCTSAPSSIALHSSKEFVEAHSCLLNERGKKRIK